MNKILIATVAAALIVATAFAAHESINVPRHALMSKRQKPVKGGLGFKSPTYFIAWTGQKPGPNVRLATLWDVQSQEFVDWFNFNQGLDFDATYQPTTACCLYGISEGYLTVRGSIGDPNNYSYVAPFTPQGQRECAYTLSGTQMFGCIINFGWCQNQFFNNLTMDLVSRFAFTNTIQSAIGCGAEAESFGIYKAIAPPPKFIASGFGSDFPTPPKGYALATLADIQSAEFASEYNNGKLAWNTDGGASMDGCCVFWLKGGYWTQQDGSWWSIFTSTGSFDCSTSPSSPIGLGFAAGVGPEGGQFVQTLTSTYTSKSTTVATLSPTLGCGQPADTYAIYKVVS